MLAKGYLNCRMEKGLMAQDSFDNLGLVFDEDKSSGPAVGSDKKQGT